MNALLDALTPRRICLAIAAAAVATLAGAWTYQAMGFIPCELCLMQRWPYYAAAPIAALGAFAPPKARRLILLALGLIFVASAAFGLFHSGVEWKLWSGPTACTGSAAPAAASMNDFMKQLESVHVTRCDEAALRIFGLSLAGWNAIISSGLAALAFAGARRS
jgi:disulfide bond formation protein DsbB